MAEEPHPEDVEDEERFLPVPAEPNELRWWELQLGFALPEGLYTELPTGR